MSEASKEKKVLDELKNWLQMGVACLGSDNCYEEGSVLEERLQEKVATMKMVLEQIRWIEEGL